VKLGDFIILKLVDFKEEGGGGGLDTRITLFPVQLDLKIEEFPLITSTIKKYE